MVSCENCGNDVKKLSKYSIEGCQMMVCKDCGELGTPVREYKPKPKRPRIEETVIPEAGQLIKAERENRNMRQVDLAKMMLIKESLVQNIEANHLPLSLALAKQFEEALGLVLIEKTEE